MQIQRLLEYDVNVEDTTHKELLTLTSQMCHKSKTELQKLLTEAEKSRKGDLLIETWKQDVEERVAFQKDQKKNGKQNLRPF